MSENDRVKNWWVNLRSYNAVGQFNINRAHANLLEIVDVKSLIFNNLLGTSTVYSYDFVSDSKPNIVGDKRLSFTLHSPLSLSYTENDGTIVDVNNPYGRYSQYFRFGEVQIIDIYDDETGTIRLDGEKTGSFTLEVEEVENNAAVATTTYSGIPSGTSTVALIEVSGNKIEDTASLTVDYEGNGQVDFTLEPVEGEEITMPVSPPSEPTLTELAAELKLAVNTHVSDKNIKRTLVNQIDAFLRAYTEHSKLVNRSPLLALLLKNSPVLKIQLAALNTQVDLYVKLKKINKTGAAELSKILELMKKKI